MTSLDLDNDEFLRLLTDALRAGPGSPEWHQAVARLRTEGHAQGNEYKLLLEAREHLESGKGYRAVRAGPGFTAKVLRSMEEQSDSRLGTPSTGNLIIGLSVLLVLGLLGALGYVLIRGGEAGPGTGPGLGEQLFTRTALDTRFVGPIPPQWRTIGKLELETKAGLSIARGQGEKDTYLGGGVVAANTLAPEEIWAADVELRPSPAPDGVTQVFVSESEDFSPDGGTSPRELQVVLRDGYLSVVTADGREVARRRLERTDPRLRDIRIRIAVNRDSAVVKLADQVVWTGTHQLSPTRPRSFGVRLLRKGANPNDTAVVQSIQLLKP